jgi:hypothetical protein
VPIAGDQSCAGVAFQRSTIAAQRSRSAALVLAAACNFKRWATEAGLPKRCRLHGLKRAALRRLADVGNTAHELMAVSGHKTLSEVQRYTEDADRKRLAASGMAKRRGQSENSDVTNIEAPLHKHGQKTA